MFLELVERDENRFAIFGNGDGLGIGRHGLSPNGLGLQRSAALQPCPSARPGGKVQGRPGGGGSPRLHKRIEVLTKVREHVSARKAGETVPVERQRSLAPRQGTEPPSNRPGQSGAAAGRKDGIRI